MKAINLRDEYRRQVELLIETYPAQLGNRTSYLQWLDGAQEGITTRRISFKGFTLVKGSRVLFKMDEFGDGMSIWILDGRENFHKALVRNDHVRGTRESEVRHG